MKVAIEVGYTVTVTRVIELPKGKTWDDVSHHYVKWGSLGVEFGDDGKWFELGGNLADVCLDDMDFKRPDYTTVYSVEKDGTPAYDDVLDTRRS